MTRRDIHGGYSITDEIGNSLIPQPLHLPRLGVAEFGKAQAGGGLAGAGEEALHQGALVVPERPQPRPLGPAQIVQRRQAIGDFLLFGE